MSRPAHQLHHPVRHAPGPHIREPAPDITQPGDHSEGLRVLLCDDHEVFRLGLRSVVTRAADMVVVGEASDPGRAMVLAVDRSPHVAVVAQSLTDGGLGLVRQLGRNGTGVVVLAESNNRDDLFEALRAGARGYLTRRATAEHLADGIRAVGRRDVTIDGAVTGHLMHYLDGDRPPASGRRPAATSLEGQLTERQRGVAALVAEGLSNAEIAARLFLSQATVKSHLTIILKRLNLRDRTQLAIMVNRHASTDGPSEMWA
jgi:DNA-binding NarL/FixJ family response regulator